MAKALALAAIRFYQQSISPRKGFCCAYAAHTGRRSCSALGYRAIQRYGVWRGLFVLDARLHKCGAAHRRHHPVGALAGQAGFLDCGGCDAPGCDLPGDCHFGSGGNKALNCLDGCSSCGDCDWRSRKKKKNEREQYVVVSPTTRLKR
ncbi:membrane protein insertion efficiency factor YidD [Massilia sp. H-1]|nr:membrane protein insertion efficiency factor YidD [Massilia sp. H-1]